MATIGLTPNTDLLLNNLVQTFGFKEARDAALFAFAYAVRNKLGVQEELMKYGIKTKWGTSTFQDINYKMIIDICCPQYQISEDDSLKLFEGLIHVGIHALSRKMDENPKLRISDLLSE